MKVEMDVTGCKDCPFKHSHSGHGECWDHYTPKLDPERCSEDTCTWLKDTPNNALVRIVKDELEIWNKDGGLLVCKISDLGCDVAPFHG